MTGQLSTGRKFIYGLVVAAVVALAGFGLCEVVLRLAGFGYSTRFFRLARTGDGTRVWRENRRVTAPYFPPELIRRPQSLRLSQKKEPGTYRIFVLGSSAAMGDPEPAFSFARQLEVILGGAYPQVKIEVVNAGITAINSHVVRVLAEDCARLEPDLFIVYEGNNEVIGPYGPGTVFSSFLGSGPAIRFGQAVKSTRTGQALAALARKARHVDGAPAGWGGMQMFLKSEIAASDPRLATTRKLFAGNLRAIAASGRDAGATVLLCTVLTNEKDFAPFVSRHRAGLSAEDLSRWEMLFVAGEQAAAGGDDAGAEEAWRGALALDGQHAELHFQLGRLCLRGNRAAEAAKHLAAARDLDCLRFRTDSGLNETIREVARRGGEGVELVDLAAEAAQKSQGGVVGDAFLYEHVHLSFQGTYEMASVLAGRVGADLVRRGRVEATATALPTVAEVRQRLAYTTNEQAMIVKELQSRFERAPFTAQTGNDARLKLYATRAETARLMLAQPGVRERVIAQYEEALVARPDDWMLRRNAGMALLALGEAPRAKQYLEQAVAWIDDDADSWFALGMAQRALGDEQAAGKSFACLRELEPRHPGLAAAGKKE